RPEPDVPGPPPGRGAASEKYGRSGRARPPSSGPPPGPAGPGRPEPPGAPEPAPAPAPRGPAPPEPVPGAPPEPGAPPVPEAGAGAGAGLLRGANQSLPLFALAGSSAADDSVEPPSRGCAEDGEDGPPDAPVPPDAPPVRPEGADGGVPGRGVLPVCSASERPEAMSLSAIGVRITTGGMGRDPGMLIRMRVVSVVSVFGSSGRGGSTDSGVSSEPAGDEYWRDPYGGVPDGYAAPPRPWGPEDELSVSRLKAGSPDWLRRPYFPHAAGQGTARRAHHHTGRRRRTLRDRGKPPPRHHTCGGHSGRGLSTSDTGPAVARG
ncbi:hypothetical protein GA0115243_100662, partial [Streptomyces sp. ScaeMP-e83]